MSHLNSGKSFLALALLALAFACAGSARAAVTTVHSDNLTKTIGGAESAAGARKLTTSFTTGADATYLQSLVLMLANPTGGQATLSVYTNSLLKPGTLVGKLASPTSFTAAASATTFNAGGIPLSPNTTYWVVLEANSGSFTWAWTTDNTGTGAGYTHTWGESDDAGATWQTYNVYPLQMRVVASTADSIVPTIQFSAASLQAGEAGGALAVPVTRSGDTSAAATVAYSTSDAAGLTACNVAGSGAASSRCDYATSVGTLSFAAGETSKTVYVPLVDDGFADGDESFTVTLGDAAGADLASPSTATVRIVDNDGGDASANPIDGTPFFVRQHYIDFLGREPEAAGYAGWQSILNKCAAGDATCDRVEVSAGFFRSAEFQTRGY